MDGCVRSGLTSQFGDSGWSRGYYTGTQMCACLFVCKRVYAYVCYSVSESLSLCLMVSVCVCVCVCE